MKKIAFLVLMGCALGLPTLEAALYKGQKLYVMKCRSCHGLGQDFVTGKTQDEWVTLMKDKGAPLIDIHLESDEAAEVHKYFEGRRWERNSRHIRQFMIEYAADSGNIPACE